MSSEAPTRGVSATGPRLTVDGLCKMYALYRHPGHRLVQPLMRRRLYREFWALRDVSFAVRPGEVYGVIGRNGSGKSTLLQLLAGVLEPTAGEARLRGRVVALLDLTSGFHPEETGRSNILLKAAIEGMSRAEIEARMDAILAFADIGDFIDQPIKTYSTGMLLRLAFSVLAHLDADILLVDEMLAVGDVFFRQKCFGRMQELLDGGASIVLVTHDMLEVHRLCKEVVLLDAGSVAFRGPAAEAVSRFYLLERGGLPPQDEAVETADAPSEVPLPEPEPAAFLDLSGVTQVAGGAARCTRVAITDSHGRACRSVVQGEELVVFYEFELAQAIEVPIGGVLLRDEHGAVVHGKSTLQLGTQVPSPVPAGRRLAFRQTLQMSLRTGEYTLDLGLSALARRDHEARGRLSHEDLHGRITRLCHPTSVAVLVVIGRPQGEGVQLLHHGLADLPGDGTAWLVPDGAPEGAAAPARQTGVDVAPRGS